MVEKKVLFAIFFFVLSSVYLQAEDRKDYIKLGGAVRFNMIFENYEESNKALDAAIKLDTWFLSADVHKSGFDLSLQYRFYPDIKNHFLHHAYMGYKIDQHWYAKLGVFQRPFGIGDFASHSWWFQVPYYLGLEDAYGTGVGAIYKKNKLTIDLAYFRQAVPKGFTSDNASDNAVGNGRYAYAIVPTTGVVDGEVVDASIRELNQFNARLRYAVSPDMELGVSGQFGGLYNSVLDKSKWGLNWALHVLYNPGNWSMKGEVIGYNYNAVADNGGKPDIVQMGAYGSAYDVASNGKIYVAGIAYTIPANRKFVSSVQLYLDYSVVVKEHKDYYDTHHLIPGMLIRMGPVYTHIDYALGKNQPWLTSHFGQGLGEGKGDANWNGRFNINIGYYF